MDFSFKTVYDQKAMTAVARGLRKTLRKKHSRRSHVFGYLVILLAIFLVCLSGNLDLRAIFTLLAALVILLTFIFEDQLNGYIGRKRMLPGTNKVTSVFSAEAYYTATEIGKTEFYYNNIVALAETEDYFIFLFSNNHGQIYDKRNLSGGSIDDFRTFIIEKTGKEITSI